MDVHSNNPLAEPIAAWLDDDPFNEAFDNSFQLEDFPLFPDEPALPPVNAFDGTGFGGAYAQSIQHDPTPYWAYQPYVSSLCSRGTEMSPVEELGNPETTELRPQLDQATTPLSSSPEPPERPRRTQNNRATSYQGTDSPSKGDVGESSPQSQTKDRRNQIRARNRKAASKCRVRKTHYIDQLRGTEDDLRKKHRSLTSETKDLQEEVLQLKAKVLDHGSCGCDQIDQYIQHAANLFSSPTQSRQSE